MQFTAVTTACYCLQLLQDCCVLIILCCDQLTSIYSRLWVEGNIMLLKWTIVVPAFWSIFYDPLLSFESILGPVFVDQFDSLSKWPKELFSINWIQLDQSLFWLNGSKSMCSHLSGSERFINIKKWIKMLTLLFMIWNDP